MTDDDLKHIHERLESGAERMQSIEGKLQEQKAELDRNTALTQAIQTDTADILAALAAARLGLKVLGGMGTVAKWATPFVTLGAALYGLWQSIKVGGPR
jgi:hypothetical protein